MIIGVRIRVGLRQGRVVSKCGCPLGSFPNCLSVANVEYRAKAISS
jgi:hypothetical protein